MARFGIPLSVFAALVLLLVVLNQVTVTHAATSAHFYQARHLLSLDCSRACGARCSKSSRKKICIPNCKACCKRCNCVPPGTAGNRQLCPCYANLKNSKGTGKCP